MATTGVATTLGSFSHTSTYSGWTAFDYNNFYNLIAIDEPLVLFTRGTRAPGNVAQNELFIARPGVAGSLTRVNAAP
ncbi:MAG: hypothetical protein RLZZ618_3061 [Pseudomonadota bacterium]